MTPMQPVRIGLVGYGKGGRFFHAPLIIGAAGCELAGVVTRSAGRRDDLGRDHPGTPAYDDLAQLAPAGVDAVVISTPAGTHVPLALEAISLGLPVVPLTVYQNRRPPVPGVRHHRPLGRRRFRRPGRRADGRRLPGCLGWRVGSRAA